MTTPTQAKHTSGRGGGRSYAWPPHPPHEMEVYSVTRAIGEGLPKPALIGWAAKVAAECAVEDHDIVAAFLAKGDKRAAIDHIKGARYRDMGAKADRGTIVHAALEGYLAGKKFSAAKIHEQLTEAHVPAKLWKSATNMVNGLMEFLFDEEPEVLWSEATVYSREHGYAGTADVIARMRVGDSVVPVVLDVKTSKAIYEDTALQLVAYARADFVGLDDGTEMSPLPDDMIRCYDPAPLPEGSEEWDEARWQRWDASPESDPVPNYDGGPRYGVVVRPTPSGSYEKAVFTLTDEVYDLFLSVLAVATGKDVLKTVRRPS